MAPTLSLLPRLRLAKHQLENQALQRHRYSGRRHRSLRLQQKLRSIAASREQLKDDIAGPERTELEAKRGGVVNNMRSLIAEWGAIGEVVVVLAAGAVGSGLAWCVIELLRLCNVKVIERRKRETSELLPKTNAKID